MTNHLELARQIVDDEAGWNRCNSPLEVRMELMQHQVQTQQAQQLADMHEEINNARRNQKK